MRKLNVMDYKTILFFMIGFIFSVLDFNLLEQMKNYFIQINIYIFWISYLLMIILLSYTAKIMIRNIELLRITGDKTFLQSIKLVLVGYYIGFLINVSNAFVLVAFQKFQEA